MGPWFVHRDGVSSNYQFDVMMSWKVENISLGALSYAWTDTSDRLCEWMLRIDAIVIGTFYVIRSIPHVNSEHHIFMFVVNTTSISIQNGKVREKRNGKELIKHYIHWNAQRSFERTLCIVNSTTRVSLSPWVCVLLIFILLLNERSHHVWPMINIC